MFLNFIVTIGSFLFIYSPKDAARAIRKRLSQNMGKNHTAVMYTLTVSATNQYSQISLKYTLSNAGFYQK